MTPSPDENYNLDERRELTAFQLASDICGRILELMNEGTLDTDAHLCLDLGLMTGKIHELQKELDSVRRVQSVPASDPGCGGVPITDWPAHSG